MTSRAELLRKTYGLKPHEEGGSFAEVYSSAAEKDGRAFAGSIYFLLEKKETSRLHEIDCEEIWYYHEGCGMRITVLDAEGKVEQLLLGSDVEEGQRAMAVIPAGAIFAAENLDKEGYTFVSCATSPKFSYAGFRLISREDLLRDYPAHAKELDHLT